MSRCKKIDLNGNAYINYIRNLAPILWTELRAPKIHMLET